MALKDMFRSAPAMDGAQARKYMQEHDSGSYTLLDVRQRREYEEGHIPGALLIPLPQLSDGLGELAKDRPTVVYCAIGGRSERRNRCACVNRQRARSAPYVGGWDRRASLSEFRAFHLR